MRNRSNNLNVNKADEETAQERLLERNNIHSISTLYGAIYLLGLLILYVIVYLMNSSLPAPLNIQDEVEYPDSFITERARHDLRLLTQFGPRIVGGYENEIGAVDFLKKELSTIKNEAHIAQNIEIDFQVVSGSYYLDYKPFGIFNSYGNVQNIAVKLNSENNSRHSLLVNAHFDSVPGSPGGSDDGINCVVMMEILRKLSRLDRRPKHNIIFLFNGAEEAPLLASHGFITQHKWAKEIQVVINLEAAGSGGKEILFQTGPNQPWLLKYYSMVPHPLGQASGEEIFQSNLIPSDTDFRIFRDFGNTIGYDLAFFQNGYRYHTSYDDFPSILLGSYQHVGDNMLCLIRNLANAPELENPKAQNAKAVFFDVFGLFVIYYSEDMAYVVNTVVVTFSFIVAAISFRDFRLGFNREVIKITTLTTSAILLGWILSGSFMYIVAVVIDGLNHSMSWYRNPIFIVGLYVVPVIMCSCIPIILLNNYHQQTYIGIDIQSQMQAHIVRIIWSIVILIGTFLKIRTVFVLLFPVLFTSVAFYIIHLLRLHYSARKWKIIYLISALFPTMTMYSYTILILSLFIPITGRIGSNRNPEIVIGLISFAITIVISCFYIHFITIIRKPLYLLYGFFAIFLVTFLIVLTPLGFPYSGNSVSPKPQRFMIMHIRRIFRNDNAEVFKRDSGYFILNMDRNSPDTVISHIEEFKRAVSVTEDCKRGLICGFPLLSPRAISVMEECTWIPAEEPLIHENVELNLNSRTLVKSTLLRLNFTATGPTHLNIYISPKNKTRLVGTSLSEKLSSKHAMWNGRPIFFINYVWGKEKTNLNFYLDIETPENWNEHALDIAISGKFVHKSNKYTSQFAEFLQKFPNWADIISGLATFESFVI